MHVMTPLLGDGTPCVKVRCVAARCVPKSSAPGGEHSSCWVSSLIVCKVRSSFAVLPCAVTKEHIILLVGERSLHQISSGTAMRCSHWNRTEQLDILHRAACNTGRAERQDRGG